MFAKVLVLLYFFISHVWIHSVHERIQHHLVLLVIALRLNYRHLAQVFVDPLLELDSFMDLTTGYDTPFNIELAVGHLNAPKKYKMTRLNPKMYVNAHPKNRYTLFR